MPGMLSSASIISLSIRPTLQLKKSTAPSFLSNSAICIASSKRKPPSPSSSVIRIPTTKSSPTWRRMSLLAPSGQSEHGFQCCRQIHHCAGWSWGKKTGQSDERQQGFQFRQARLVYSAMPLDQTHAPPGQYHCGPFRAENCGAKFHEQAMELLLASHSPDCASPRLPKWVIWHIKAVPCW